MAAWGKVEEGAGGESVERVEGGILSPIKPTGCP